MRQLLQDRDGDGVPDGIQALATLQAAQAEKNAQVAKLESERQALAQLRQRHTASLQATPKLATAAVYAAMMGLVASILWQLIAVRWQDVDPWFGAHHRVFCPLVCSDCEGPYVIFSWTAYSTSQGSSGESTKVYCQTHPEQFASYRESDFLGGLRANRKYELPGATYALWLSAVPMWVVLMLPVGIVVNRVVARRQRAEAPKLAAQIRDLEARLPQ